MNFADIIILALLVVAAFFCVRSIRKSFSSGGCIGCPDGESCRRKQDTLSGCSCCGELKPEDIHIKKRNT